MLDLMFPVAPPYRSDPQHLVLLPKLINHKNRLVVYVIPSLQLGMKVDDGEVWLSKYLHIFIIQDVADAFGALKSGSAAWGQVSDPPHSSGGALTYVPSLGGACCLECCTADQRTRH